MGCAGPALVANFVRAFRGYKWWDKLRGAYHNPLRGTLLWHGMLLHAFEEFLHPVLRNL
jgi:hypothetical protein